MTFLEALLTGLDEARRHIGQTLLSLLGLILGTASIVTVLALFGGQSAATQQFILEVGGAGTVIVRDRELPVRPSARELASKRMTFRDAEYLRHRASALGAVAPGWADNLRYTAGTVSFTGQVIGTVPDYMRINDIAPLSGRFLSDLDVAQQHHVIVLGWKFADSLFGDPLEAVGRTLSLEGVRLTVVGVLEREEFYFAAWEDNALEWRNERAYIPITTAFTRYTGGVDRLGFLTLQAVDGASTRLAESQVRSLLFQRHGVEDFDITPSGAGGGGDTTQFLMLFNFIFLVVGIVSLFTGGVVIANILLASVVERVREFGTRMAIGATGSQVFGHVIAQVTVIAVLGGLAGLGLGAALTGAVARLMQMPAVVTPPIAGVGLGTALLVGFLAGLYPALRAARLSPVEALRYG